MRGTDVRDLLGRLEETSAPEPSALFVTKLEADLRAMDRTVPAEARRPRRARLLALAAPVAALTAAAAAAAVTLLPSDPHPRQVRTADPGVTAPSAPPEASPSPGPTPTTVVAPPWLPTVAPPVPQTTAVPRPVTTTPASPPVEHPAPTVVTTHEPATTAVPPPPTTVAPAPETLSLNCQGAMVNGSAAVSCAWSPSSSQSFAWYRLYREVPGTNRVLIFSSDMRTKTSYGDKTPQAGTTYSYRVEATDSAGNVLGRSAAVTVPCC